MKKVILFLCLLLPIVCFSQNAQDIIDGLKKELQLNPEDKKKATIYSDLTWYYSNVSLDSALVYGKKAINQSLKVGDSIVLSQAYGDISTVYLKKGDFNLSLAYMNKVLAIREAKKDVLGLAKVYSGIGLLYYNQNEYNLSMKNYLKALDYVNKTDNEKVKYNIQNAMSALLTDLKDYKKALKYSENAIKFYEKNNATEVLCAMYINRGNIYLGLNDTINALKYYEKGKLTCNASGNKLFYSKAINNIGNIKYAQKKYAESKKLFDQYNEENKGLNSEFMDYKMKINDVGELIRNQKFEEAKTLLITLKNYFKKQNDLENLLRTYTSFVPVCANLKEVDSVAFYHLKFLQLNKKLNDSEVLNKTIELETKYQTAKKEKQLLVKENQVKKSQNISIVFSLIALFSILIGYLLYRNQKTKNIQQKQEFELKSALAKIEAQNELQEQRLSISRDLHDNIGSQLTFVISSIENLKFGIGDNNPKAQTKLSQISDFTKSTITELRDTIWAMNNNEIVFDDLRVRIHNFLGNAKIAQEKIDFNFHIDDTLKEVKLTSFVWVNVYRTIQEAVNNAIKYAEATKIGISVNEIEGQIQIQINDNGKGFDITEVKRGNGLFNMEKRIAEIGGDFSLQSEIRQGTTILISIKK